MAGFSQILLFCTLNCTFSAANEKESLKQNNQSDFKAFLDSAILRIVLFAQRVPVCAKTCANKNCRKVNGILVSYAAFIVSFSDIFYYVSMVITNHKPSKIQHEQFRWRTSDQTTDLIGLLL